MNLTEKTLHQEYKFKGRIFNVRVDEIELPDGKQASREVVEHRGGVCVLPLTDEGEVIMVRQFRYPNMEVMLEIPAGKRDGDDEEPIECGKRELKEEVGAESDHFVLLSDCYPTPAYATEHIYIYYADNLRYGQTNPDEDEFLDIVKIPFDKALEMVMTGEIKDAKTQLAILKTAILKQQNKL